MPGSVFEGRFVVIGITGGIAAYKACEVVSALAKTGARVHVIMTEAATHFVAPLTFRTLSGNPVSCDMFSDPGEWNVKHVSLAESADLIVVVPATANCIGKLASGIADDLLTTTLMATRAPVLLVPAMNEAMYLNPIVQSNKEKLESVGYRFMSPETGYLACGKVGAGRLPETGNILREAERILVETGRPGPLAGRTFLITAGPTREPVDPVRFVTNRSSGKMGYALARAARARGAHVVLVTGPTSLVEPAGCDIIHVERTEEMKQAVMQRFEQCDVVVMAAAVADYAPADVASSKIKKHEGELILRLIRTPDILGELGKAKARGKRILVGFAAETESVIENARQKLAQKNLDLIVANDVRRNDIGFDSDYNEVTMIFRDGRMVPVPRSSKQDVAGRIIDAIMELYNREKE